MEFESDYAERVADDDEVYEERPEFLTNFGRDQLRNRLLAAVRRDDAPGVLQHVADNGDSVDIGEALRLAAERGSACVVRELVAIGLTVDVGCPQTGFTPLHLAAANGHVSACELLLEALADVHLPVACGGNSMTALTLARAKGNLEVEEVIEQHMTKLILPPEPLPDCIDVEEPILTRANVLPRISPFLSEAILCNLRSGPSTVAIEPEFMVTGDSASAPGCQLRMLMQERARNRGPELNECHACVCNPEGTCQPLRRNRCWKVLTCWTPWCCENIMASSTYHELKPEVM